MYNKLPAAGTLSRPAPAWKIMIATMIKDLRIAVRYLPNLAGTFVQLAIRIAFFLLLANSLSLGGSGLAGRALTGRELFLFYQSALLLLVFRDATLWAPLNAVSQDLYNGTLEFLYSTPGSRYAYYVGTVLQAVSLSFVVFLPFYLLMCFTSGASAINMLMVLLVCIVVGTALTAMGIMMALLALLWRQVNSVTHILGLLFEFLGGAYLPVSSFPAVVRYASFLLPYTWGYDLIRYYSFGGQWETLAPVRLEWIIIAAYAVLYTLLSRYLLKKSERRSKKTGLNVI